MSEADRRPGPNEQYCPNCRNVIAQNAAMCPECGTSFGTATELVCEQCREPVDPAATACPHCGHQHSKPTIRYWLTIIAVILWPFIGPWGFLLFIDLTLALIVGLGIWILLLLQAIYYYRQGQGTIGVHP